MKQIKICYTDNNNLGDAINKYILERVFEMTPVVSTAFNCEITGIGSGLRRFFVDMSGTSIKRKLRFNFHSIFNRRPLTIWSAGFLTTPKGDELILRRNYRVSSVRGELSRQWIEKISGKKIDCTTGDAGLLASLLIDEKIEKKYAVGIIPNLKEKDEPYFQELHNKLPNSIVIDVLGDVISTIKTIAECEVVVSSSLHGLIIADSFCVPSKRVILTDKPSGDGFKFDDYYSAFGLSHEPIDLNLCNSIDIEKIKTEYPFTEDIIQKKQKEIIEAFHRR